MKILLVQMHGVIAPHVISAYERAFAQLGHQVMMVEDGANGFLPLNKMRERLEYKPDLLVTYGIIGSKLNLHMQELQNIPTVNLHYDNPYFFIKDAPQELIDVLSQKNMYHFVWDASFRNLLGLSGLKNIYPIMLAADPTLFYPQGIKPATNVGIVASFNKQQALQQTTSHKHLDTFINNIIAKKISRVEMPILEIMEQLLAQKDNDSVSLAHEVIGNNPYALWDIYDVVHKKGTPIVRDHFARRMADRFETHIYGNTVLDNMANVTIHQPVHYQTELSGTYQRHKVIQNISSLQLETSVNNRVFDGLASGSYVLSDHKRDMAVIFPAHYEALTFSTVEEMWEKTDYYLSHEKERKELIDDARNIVLEHHTYKHRAQSIINTVFGGLSHERFIRPQTEALSVSINGTSLQITKDQIVDLFHYVYYNSRVWEQTHWCGHQILKCPLDMWIYQEILWSLRPDFIIEAGTFRGGSAFYYAHLFDIIGHGKIITIDIMEQPHRPKHRRITYLTGSSADPAIFQKVSTMVGKGKKVMVVLDSDHSKAHVLEEMRLWWPMVTVGHYMIVEDSNVNGHPVRPDFGPGPMEAIAEFLRENARFRVDYTKEKFFMTQNPSGYLERTH